MPFKIDILIYPGVDELDAIAPYEVLTNAASAGADFAVRLVSYGNTDEIVAAHGARMRPHVALDRQAPPDLIVVTGGGWNSRAPQGARTEAARGVIPELIGQLHARGTVIASVCTGAMLLAAAGLLRGVPAVTHHNALDDLAAAGARVIRARVVDADRIITAGGITSGLDLALWIVERFAGAEIATAVEGNLEYERRGTVWRAKA